MSKTLDHAMRQHLAERPDKVFWRHLTQAATVEVTFAQFHARSEAFAEAYLQAGLQPGEVVLIFLPHHPDTVSAFFGAMLLGAVPSLMPLPSAKQHPAIYWPGHAELVRRIGARVLLTDAAHAGQMHEHGLAAHLRHVLTREEIGPATAPIPVRAVDPAAIALLQHSSGTTALKKGVALSHRAILRQVAAYSSALGMGEPDNIISWLPLYHDMGLIACTVTPLVLGQTVTCLDPFEWSARPASLLDAIDRFGGNFVWMPNFGFELMTRAVPADHIADLSSLKALISCSEPARPKTAHRFLQRFAPLGLRRRHLQVCYAMAETVFAISQTTPQQPVPIVHLSLDRLALDGVAADAVGDEKSDAIMSTGAVLAGLDLRIRDEHGADLPDNGVGEVTLSGDFLFDGYFNTPQTTAERLVDGRYHTRDLGFLRRGQLYILGRKDDLVIINGRNLYAHEVEAIVNRIPGLKPGRVVAFASFDAAIGSDQLIVVAERDQAAHHPGAKVADDRRIGRQVREAVYDRTNIDVGAFRIVDPGWLVKTSSGKISRAHNLRKYLAEQHAAVDPATTAAAPDAATTLGRLARLIGKQFRFPAALVDQHTVAGDVPGWNSLAHAALILQVERQFRVRFDDREIYGFPTVGTLSDRVDQLLRAGRPDAAALDRVVYQSETTSILRFGDAADGPDIIIFAGLARKLGGIDLLDFFSVLEGTGARDLRKFFVTDLKGDWFNRCFDEVVAQLNAVSDRPKIIIGNSMGGYGALRFAPYLNGVTTVLSIVPASLGARHDATVSTIDSTAIRFAPGVQYCVVFGELEDSIPKAAVAQALTNPTLQHVVTVPNCGHDVVPYLNRLGLLQGLLDTALRGPSMGREVAAIAGGIAPNPKRLGLRIAHLERTAPRIAKRETAAAKPPA